MDVSPTTGDRPRPEQAGVGRIVTGMAVSAGAGMVAEQVRRSLSHRGSAPAILAGLAGGAIIESVAEGALGAIDNVRAGRDWSTDLGEHMADGLPRGVVDAGLGMAALPAHRALSVRLPQLGTIGLAAGTGLVLGVTGGAAATAVDRRSWREGTAAGWVHVGQGALWGGLGGAVLGGATGAVVHRFFPSYPGGAATRHHVRRLVIERGNHAVTQRFPKPKASWEVTAAHAKSATHLVFTGKGNMATLGTTPQMKAFLKELRPGDIVLVGRGSTKAPVVNGYDKQPYRHAFLIAEGLDGPNGGRVISALGKGVSEVPLVEYIGWYLPKSGKPRTSYSIIRPSEDPEIAQAAVTFARAKLGQPFNTVIDRGRGGLMCSQLCYEAYEANPAIASPPLKLLQLDEDTRHFDRLRVIGRNGGLWDMGNRVQHGTYRQGAFWPRTRLYLTDVVRVAGGGVRYVFHAVRAAISKDGGATLAVDYRYQPLKHVLPSDLDLADGRKIATLLVDALPEGKLSP